MIEGAHVAVPPTRPAPQLSIVFVTFNSSGVIADALASARRVLPAAEIIVVDNGSTDDSVAIARRHSVDLIVEGHGNVGYGAGANRGALAARGTLLLVTNPDVTVAAANEARLSELAARARPGVLGCSLVVAGRDQAALERLCSPRFELYWGLLNWFLLPREANLAHPTAPRRRTSRAWVTGAALLFSRAEFLEIGGFDERLFLYFEDMELCHRYALRGRSVSLTDAIALVHDAHSSSPRDEDRIIAWALLSLVEFTASSRGAVAATSVARTALTSLAKIELAGRALRWVPRLGERSVQKASSAHRVRAQLLAHGGPEVPPSAYPTARRILDGLVAAG